MCRICTSNAPSQTSFENFRKKASDTIGNLNSLSELLGKARIVDQLRFDTGDEWGEPSICQSVSNLIFCNPDPDEGLLLFMSGCWLDMLASYTVVWSQYLEQAKNWMDGKGPVPRGGFRHTTSHLLLTRGSLEKYGNVGLWFVRNINEIAETYGKAKGNIYRFAGELCSDFYSKPEVVDYLRNGALPNLFSGGDHKRFWMFLMFLRRDNSVVKCLFERALQKFEGGQEALQYWYNNEYFNPIECELPVDTWVLNNWNGIFGKLKLPNFQTKGTSQADRAIVASRARNLAAKNGISPSTLDAIMFYG